MSRPAGRVIPHRWSGGQRFSASIIGRLGLLRVLHTRYRRGTVSQCHETAGQGSQDAKYIRGNAAQPHSLGEGRGKNTGRPA